MCLFLTSCGSRKVDKTRESESQAGQHEQRGQAVETGHREKQWKERQSFDFSRLLYDIRPRDSSAYYFRQGDMEFFGNADLTAAKTGTAGDIKKERIYVHDTIVQTDTVFQTEYVYRQAQDIKHTERKSRSFWPYLICLCIGVLIGRYGKALWRNLKSKLKL